MVDVDSATIRKAQDVSLRDGRILAVEPTRSRAAAGGAQIVEAQGLYLVPALWDLHVHLESFTAPDDKKLHPRKWNVPLAMSYGVLGMRDMGSRTGDILALRDGFASLRASGEPAPLLRVAGQSFSGRQPWGTFDHTLVPETPAEAADLVRKQIALGVDFIKVHDFLTPETHRAVVATARAGGMPVIGHLRSFSGPVDAAALGQTGFDHLPPELLAYCGPNGESDTEAFYAGWYTGGPGYYEREMAKLYDPAGCAALFGVLATKGVSVTPTLSVRAPVHDRTYDAAKRFLPDGQMAKCTASKTFLDSATGPDVEAYRAMIASVVRGMADAGIDILTGTDGAPESCGVPGLVLLDELDELVKAGLKPGQVLRAATLGGAREAGVQDAGTITPGALADLILLDGNPLENLAVLEEPSGIVSAGGYVSRAELLAWREQAASYAQSLNVSTDHPATAPRTP